MISLEELECLDVVRGLIGQSISKISNSQYFYNDEIDDEDLGDLEILTSSGLKVCFNLLNDGESVGAYSGDLKTPLSFEITEGEQASWKKLTLKYSSKVEGSKIVTIDAMYDTYPKLKSKVRAGWRVKLSNDNYFVFYNCGDNARLLFNELPNNGISGLETTWQKI